MTYFNENEVIELMSMAASRTSITLIGVLEQVGLINKILNETDKELLEASVKDIIKTDLIEILNKNKNI